MECSLMQVKLRQLESLTTIGLQAFRNLCTIPYQDCVKDLGLLIDHNLNWIPHAQSVAQKLIAGQSCLWPHAYYILRHIKIVLLRELYLYHSLHMAVL